MRRAILLIGLWLAGCTPSHDTAGGTATETTNGMVVVCRAGVPVAGAVAYVIDNRFWFDRVQSGSSPVIDTLTSDSTGRIHSPIPLMPYHTLQIQLDNEAAIVLGHLDTINLTPGHRLAGVLRGGSSAVVAGTALYATSITADSYVIDNVPEGTYTIYVRDGTNLHMDSRVHFESGLPIQAEIADTTSLLVDDFLGGFDGNPLAAAGGCFSWYTFSDYRGYSHAQGRWNLESDTGIGNSTVTPSAGAGAIRCDISAGSRLTEWYAGLGASFLADSGSRGLDLSSLSGIRLKVRGSGSLMLSLKTAKLDSLNANATGAYEYVVPYHAIITLRDTMIDTLIPITNFHLDFEDYATSLTIPWASCADNVNTMQLSFRSRDNDTSLTYWFALDEIRFEGVSLPF